MGKWESGPNSGVMSIRLSIRFIVLLYVIVIPWVGCPPVRGDNPRALASGLSYVQVDKHGITILYHLHQCRPCTSQDISC